MVFVLPAELADQLGNLIRYVGPKAVKAVFLLLRIA